jgi:hypothetical protein
MKKTLFIILLALGAAQATSVFSSKPVKVEQLPEVIVNGTSSVTKGYVGPIDVNKYCPKANPVFKLENEEFAFQGVYQADEHGNIKFEKHCGKCSMGVYSFHNEESFKRCTYCGEKE